MSKTYTYRFASNHGGLRKAAITEVDLSIIVTSDSVIHRLGRPTARLYHVNRCHASAARGAFVRARLDGISEVSLASYLRHHSHYYGEGTWSEARGFILRSIGLYLVQTRDKPVHQVEITFGDKCERLGKDFDEFCSHRRRDLVRRTHGDGGL